MDANFARKLEDICTNRREICMKRDGQFPRVVEPAWIKVFGARKQGTGNWNKNPRWKVSKVFVKTCPTVDGERARKRRRGREGTFVSLPRLKTGYDNKREAGKKRKS